MSLVYVTGLSGSGKSSILKELCKRGFEAHGVDEEGYADWVDRQSGQVIPFPHDNLNLDIHLWYKKHRWALSKKRISELKDYSERVHKTVFLLGVAEGEDKVWHLFNRVIALFVDEPTIRHRVANRTDNHFGKAPEEMAEILSGLDGYEEKYLNLGATIVDARKPLTSVVDSILALCQRNNSNILSQLSLDGYAVDTKPNFKVIGKKIDDFIKTKYLGRRIAIRALSSDEHKDLTREQLVQIIQRDGTNRYDPQRKGDRYENIENKHIDIFALPLDPLVEEDSMFEHMLNSFYYYPLRTRGKPVFIDIIVIYDLNQLEAVEHGYQGRDETKRDGFIFKNTTQKPNAILEIILVNQLPVIVV